MKPLSGEQATLQAIKTIDPEIVIACNLPEVTAQYKKWMQQKEVSGEMLSTASERMALSMALGASIAGTRCMLLFSNSSFVEQRSPLTAIADLRCPVIAAVIPRKEIPGDDPISVRNRGWMQCYVEDPQEAHDMFFLATQLAERLSLPMMIVQDDITPSLYQPIDDLPREVSTLLKKPVKQKRCTVSYKSKIGCEHTIPASMFAQLRVQQERSMIQGVKTYQELAKSVSAHLTCPIVQGYELDDAEFVIVAMGGVSAVVKEVVDTLRKEQVKAGFLKIRLFRPFPHGEVAKALQNAKGIAVLDKVMSLGTLPPLFSEIKQGFMGSIQSYVYGLDGKRTTEQSIRDVFSSLIKKKYEEGVKVL